MTKHTHTPGPWKVEPHGKVFALYSGRSDYQHGLRLMNLDDGDNNFQANAQLIAAAPDMLDALTAALLHIRTLERALMAARPLVARTPESEARHTVLTECASAFSGDWMIYNYLISGVIAKAKGE